MVVAGKDQPAAKQSGWRPPIVTSPAQHHSGDGLHNIQEGLGALKSEFVTRGPTDNRINRWSHKLPGSSHNVHAWYSVKADIAWTLYQRKHGFRHFTTSSLNVMSSAASNKLSYILTQSGATCLTRTQKDHKKNQTCKVDVVNQSCQQAIQFATGL